MQANVLTKKLFAVVGMMNKLPHCVVVGNTVTSLCIKLAGGGNNMCVLNMPMSTTGVHPRHTSISGTLTTTNIIMANWSREMWQSVVNRAVRILALNPLRSHFFSAFATVS
ncbi:hypothetical protein KIN20_003219 [Parelaphostrongylus tenuis]|uniref:Uncharacterized protein n=1 Tax=Parelaphostrongylus tenuis TaxID=148309 RepID=A0AAD5QIG4_PARTN|nr:hypothetical protein KIN20_003219 [Parelaphostrongylus tenuis]